MKTVFFDVDTQRDFVFPAGALYVPGAERVVTAVARLNQHAFRHGIPVVSTMDAHAENDPEFQQWPAHCVQGAFGQRKPEASCIPGRIVVPAKPRGFTGAEAPQYLLEKTTVDAFANTHILSLLEILRPERFVVYGVVTEICVRYAALGLLKTGKPVLVVRDAVQALDESRAEEFFAELTASGGSLTTLSEIGA